MQVIQDRIAKCVSSLKRISNTINPTQVPQSSIMPDSTSQLVSESRQSLWTNLQQIGSTTMGVVRGTASLVKNIPNINQASDSLKLISADLLECRDTTMTLCKLMKENQKLIYDNLARTSNNFNFDGIIYNIDLILNTVSDLIIKLNHNDALEHKLKTITNSLVKLIPFFQTIEKINFSPLSKQAVQINPNIKRLKDFMMQNKDIIKQYVDTTTDHMMLLTHLYHHHSDIKCCLDKIHDTNTILKSWNTDISNNLYLLNSSTNAWQNNLLMMLHKGNDTSYEEYFSNELESNNLNLNKTINDISNMPEITRTVNELALKYENDEIEIKTKFISQNNMLAAQIESKHLKRQKLTNKLQDIFKPNLFALLAIKTLKTKSFVDNIIDIVKDFFKTLYSLVSLSSILTTTLTSIFKVANLIFKFIQSTVIFVVKLIYSFVYAFVHYIFLESLSLVENVFLALNVGILIIYKIIKNLFLLGFFTTTISNMFNQANAIKNIKIMYNHRQYLKNAKK